jgi:flagellar basal-body rod protein FlgF
MDRLIYTSMSGSNAASQRQSVLANNLANASTNGFRAEMSTFRSVPLLGDGASTRVFALQATSGHKDTAGSNQFTGRNLDASAVGQAWFGVQGLDGTEAYTRNGAFEISAEGNLVTGSGLQVLSDSGAPIAVPQGATVTLGTDGTISAKLGNQPPSSVGRLKMVTPTAETPIRRGPDGLFRATSGDALTNDPNARLKSGTLEGSNVNTIETMVEMIQVSRHFETQMRLLQNAESNDKAATQLLSVQG